MDEENPGPVKSMDEENPGPVKSFRGRFWAVVGKLAYFKAVYGRHGIFGSRDDVVWKIRI